MIYTKQFLIDCFLDRFVHCSLITVEQLENLEKMANEFYDKVGKDKFRVYCSLDSATIKQYVSQNC